MFSIVRMIIACIFFGCSIVMIEKSTIINKGKLRVAFAIISAILFVVLFFVPFENLFVTFDSHKAAYEYYNYGNSNIELVVEGENSDFVIDCKDDGYTYLILPKTENGCKIGMGIDTKRIVQKVYNGIVIYVYQYKNTDDYYITIFDTNGGELNISDDNNTKFYSLERNNDFLEKTFVTYYAHISEFDIHYSLSINGDKLESIRPTVKS